MCAPEGIRTPNRQIRSLPLFVYTVTSSAVWAAQVTRRVSPSTRFPSGALWWIDIGIDTHPLPGDRTSSQRGRME